MDLSRDPRCYVLTCMLSSGEETTCKITDSWCAQLGSLIKLLVSYYSICAVRCELKTQRKCKMPVFTIILWVDMVTNFSSLSHLWDFYSTFKL